MFAQDNLGGWRIVPFDAKKLGPAERAKMAKQLGFSKIAYDWRGHHVPTFEREILEYERHGIEFFAFWSWHDAFEPLVKKHGITPANLAYARLPKGWNTGGKSGRRRQVHTSTGGEGQGAWTEAGALQSRGWGGEPANLVAVCRALRNQGHEQVGIVYNFHHGHGQIETFPRALDAMKPYLLCLNLNGMTGPSQKFQKILPIGQGNAEAAMIKAILQKRLRRPHRHPWPRRLPRRGSGAPGEPTG